MSNISMIIAISVSVILAVAMRVLMVLFVKNECNNRETNVATFWTIITAVIGFISFVSFICLIPSKKEKNSAIKNKSAIFGGIYTIILLGTIIFTALFSAPVIFNYEGYEQNSFSSDTLTYENEDGEEVVYDKMGNTYTFDQLEDFKFYAKDGTTYSIIVDGSGVRTGLEQLDNGEKYIDEIYAMDYENCTTGYRFLFDREGYICKFNEDTFYNDVNIYMQDDMDGVYFDKVGNLYYYDSDFDYDYKGNIVFKRDFALKDFKYSDIPKEEYEYFFNEE